MKATDERIMKPDMFPGKSTYTASFLGNFPSPLDGNVPSSKSLVNIHSWEYLERSGRTFPGLEPFWVFNEHFVVVEESQLRETFQFWLHI